MKLRFNTYDIICAVTELQSLVGLRVNQIYDVDSKTYLIRFQGGEAKMVLLIESGIRFHTTDFEWPKNMVPSGFSMKLRKHLKNKRLEKLQQVGTDRIVDFQFGVDEAAYHVIVELYDRGNVILTDHELTILYILRPHCEGEDVQFVVRGKYPLCRARKQIPLPDQDTLRQALLDATSGESLRRILMPIIDCGPTVIDHVLKKYNLSTCFVKSVLKQSDKLEDIHYSSKNNNKGTKKDKKQLMEIANSRSFDMDNDMDTLLKALQDANEMLADARKVVGKGYIMQTKHERYSADGKIDHFYKNEEYHPYLFSQFEDYHVVTFNTFMSAVDEFYSTLEGQKIDLKALQQEREALKKLDNVKLDHAKRLEELSRLQKGDKQKAELITCNQKLVENAILAVRSAIANQMSWPDIQELVKAAQAKGDPVAKAIKQLKLEINHISLSLFDPYDEFEEFQSSSRNVSQCKGKTEVVVDIDLGLSAYSNARRYYDQKRSAAQKEQKTIDASQKALKSAKRKTQQTLKDVQTISTISKVRKVYWFEKFYWFISSENYLVIGGRDAQQNELIVKRYMRPSDIYVHAEIQGASSVIVRNPGGGLVPPKTLLEAGTMAISYSVAWDAKVVANAYWVRCEQVSKTAPTGEYLGTGSFMIRGKKNFLPSCHLVMGLSLLFKLEESFVEKHRGERRVKTFEEDRDDQIKLPSQEDEALEYIGKTELNKKEVRDVFQSTVDTQDNNYSVEPKEKFDEISEFPDTQVKVEHDTGGITIRKEGNDELQFASESSTRKNVSTLYYESSIITARPSRKKQQSNKKKKEKHLESSLPKDHKPVYEPRFSNHMTNTLPVKRGQKGKLKKIREKYKNQDEEERELRMQILKSSGRDNLIDVESKVTVTEFASMDNKVKHSMEQKIFQKDEIDDTDDVFTGLDTDMLDSLTGQPYDDDELLFVIPVVAPYQALQNYKFKVKLTPGTGKRGRAAKTALAIFSQEKHCGPREKDLLKSVKEEMLARNIPGKVKLSAPQLQKHKAESKMK